MEKYSGWRWRLADNDLLSWFVQWFPGDWVETKHCTYWMWRQRFARWFVCPRKGHDWYSDMCGRPEHDLCERCGIRRDDAEGVG